MYQFFAVVRKDPGSDFGVEFPDLPGCFSAGSDFRTAQQMAAEALSTHIAVVQESGGTIPSPRSRQEIDAWVADAENNESFFCVAHITVKDA